MVSCGGKEIDLPFGNKVSRKHLTVIVIVFDLAIVVGLVITTGVLDTYIYKEAQDLDLEFVQTTDFAVRVKNLPSIKDFKTMNQL